MVQLNFSVCTSAVILLSLITPSLSLANPALHQFNELIARQSVGSTKGGRKIGIVIDESNSMQDNDPNNTRIDAGNAIDDSLISSTDASGSDGKGKTADQVTVVGFHSEADLLYPLGDPTGAIPFIDGITSNKSGTFIGGGLKAATDELTKDGTGTTANRTGIVVLTDGQDNYSGLTGVQGTINEIARAESLGIRVSFGFLAVDAPSQDPEILTGIIKTGGTFSSFSSADSQKNFVEQVLGQGLTGQDATSASTVLLPGLVTAAILAPEGNIFSYFAKSGETLNLTITAIDIQLQLNATLRDATSKAEVARNSTSATGFSSSGRTTNIVHTSPADTALELFVQGGGDTTSGIFSVGVNSSLGLDAGRAPPKKNGAAAPATANGLTMALSGFLFVVLFWV